MVDERASPSAGWREVYHEMDADPSVEDADPPDLRATRGDGSEKASPRARPGDSPDADETNRRRGSARSD